MMFDIYLSGADLLVVPRGHSIPSEINGSWRKKKRVARAVSDRIRDDIQHRVVPSPDFDEKVGRGVYGKVASGADVNPHYAKHPTYSQPMLECPARLLASQKASSE
jgi:hypothetical protein